MVLLPQVVFNKDSSRVGPKEWVQIAKILDRNRFVYNWCRLPWSWSCQHQPVGVYSDLSTQHSRCVACNVIAYGT
jgi:hypothetical protein